MAERRFHNWEAPLLPQAAATLTEEFSGGEVVDLGETLLVFPGSRAGRRLMELLWEKAAQNKKRLIPPSAVLTIGSLPERMYRPRLPLASELEMRMAWAKALEELAPRRMEELFGPGAAAGGVGARMAMARRLVALHREVGGTGLNFREVAARCRAASLFFEEERWRNLADVQERARAVLVEAGRLDREEARREAVQAGSPRCGKTVVLVGVAEIPPLVKRMLEGVQDRVLALIHAPPELADSFDGLGVIRREEWSGRPLRVMDEWLQVVDGPAEGAEALVHFLAALDAVYAPEDIAIGVSHPEWVPFLARSLEPHGLVCRYAEGSPVSQSPPGQLLRAVLACVEEGTYRGLAALLRHPDLPLSWHPLRAAVEADRHFQVFLPWRIPLGPSFQQEGFPLGGDRGEGEATAQPPPRRSPDGVEGEGAVGRDPPAFSVEAGKLLAALEGTAPLTQWMPRCLEVVKSVYGEWEIPTEDSYRAGVLDACLTIGEVARNLWSLPPELDRLCTAGEALAILLRELEDLRLPPPVQDTGLEVMGWLELHLEDAPVVVVMGVNEPYIPESVGRDPFLPNALRSLLGLEDNEGRLARDRYRLEALLRSTSRACLVSFRKDARGESLLPSRLLLRSALPEAAERLLHFLREGEGKGRGAGFPTPPAAPNLAAGFRLPPVRVIPVPEIPRPLPVTAFALILQNPFLWALEHLLGLEEVSDGTQELDPMGFGSLAHAVLERFARTAEAASTDADEIRKALAWSLDEVFCRRFPSPPLPAVTIQREQLWARLQRFAEWQAQWVEDGWRIQAVELCTPREGVPFVVDGEAVWLSGRVDRLDRHEADGRWMLLDYKTGEGLHGGDTGEGSRRDLQLPLYRYLLRHMLPLSGPLAGVGGGQAEVGLAYLNLSARPEPLELSVIPCSEAELEEAMETARQVIRELRTSREVVFKAGAAARRLEGGWARVFGLGAFSSDVDAHGAERNGAGDAE